MRVSHCSGFSCCGARALGTWASVVVAHGLRSCGSGAVECRLSSCGTRAQLLHGIWDPPGPELEPMFPALAGGLLTTVPPGKSLQLFFKVTACYFKIGKGPCKVVAKKVILLVVFWNSCLNNYLAFSLKVFVNLKV